MVFMSAVPAVKIAQLLAAGCEVTVLIADIHGFLDNLVSVSAAAQE